MKRIADLDTIQVGDSAKTSIVFFHGYGASAQDLYPLHQVFKASDVTWYFPDGFLEVSLGMMMTGKAWFPVDMMELERSMQAGTHRDFSNLKSEHAHLAIDKTQKFLEELEHENLIIGGFSQGAMLSSHLGPRMSEKVKGLVLFSGNLVDQESLESYFPLKRNFPFIQSHGTQDPLLGIPGAKALYNFYRDKGLEGEFIEFTGGHEIPPVVIKKTQEFLTKII